MFHNISYFGWRFLRILMAMFLAQVMINSLDKGIPSSCRASPRQAHQARSLMPARRPRAVKRLTGGHDRWQRARASGQRGDPRAQPGAPGIQPQMLGAAFDFGHHAEDLSLFTGGSLRALASPLV